MLDFGGPPELGRKWLLRRHLLRLKQRAPPQKSARDQPARDSPSLLNIVRPNVLIVWVVRGPAEITAT